MKRHSHKPAVSHGGSPKKSAVRRALLLIITSLMSVIAYAAVSNFCTLTVWIIVRWVYLIAGAASFVLYFLTKKKLYLMILFPIVAAFAWEVIDLYVIPWLAGLLSQVK